MQNTRSSGVSGEGMLRILENSHSPPMALCGGLSWTFEYLDHFFIFSFPENTGQIDMGRM
jgi:hypothetical protein